jgi:c-di-GMP-binding flagellar brake protein YcgR
VVDVNELQFLAARGKGVETKCCEISEGGLSVDSPRSFKAGDKLQVRVKIPLLNKFSPGFFKFFENDADQYFLAISEVIWCKPRASSYRVGIRYINVDDSQARALAGMINKAFREEARKG